MREGSAVARRCLVLYAVLAAGHGTSRDDLAQWLRREELWDSVSPEEMAFLQAADLSRQQIIGATWRAEALFPLVWALGAIPALPAPANQCDVQLLRSALPPLFGPAAEFIEQAKVRDEGEIMDAHEATYQAHWTVRDATIDGRPVPASYNPGVIQERHLALNWLIFPEEWDDVTTDT